MREGCYLCHSQMIRTLRFETQRYGRFSEAGEFVYDRPFQWGSKRTGPDLARVGGKYSDAWQRAHLLAPRDLVPASNMPNYPWLAEAQIDGNDLRARMRALRMLGDPYTEEDLAGAPDAVRDKTELDALVAYLQGLGVTAAPCRSGVAMSELAGHLDRRDDRAHDAGVHRHLDLGLAAASQARVQRSRASAAGRG